MSKRKRVTPKLSEATNGHELSKQDQKQLHLSPIAKRTRSATKVRQSAEICQSEHFIGRARLIARKIFMNSKTHVQYSYSLNPIDCPISSIFKHSYKTNIKKTELIKDDQSAKRHELCKSIIYRPMSYVITTCGELHIRKCIWDNIKFYPSILIYRGLGGEISCTPTLNKTLYIVPLSQIWTLDKIYFSVFVNEDISPEKNAEKQKRCISNSTYKPFVQRSKNQRLSAWKGLQDVEKNIGQMFDRFIKINYQVGRANISKDITSFDGNKIPAPENSPDLNSNERNTLVSKVRDVTDIVPVPRDVTNRIIPNSPQDVPEFGNRKSSDCNDHELNETFCVDESSLEVFESANLKLSNCNENESKDSPPNLEKVVLESDGTSNHDNGDKDDVSDDVYFISEVIEIPDNSLSPLIQDNCDVFDPSNARVNEIEEANNDLCQKSCATNFSNLLLEDCPVSGELSECILKKHTLITPTMVTNEDECSLKEKNHSFSANVDLGNIEIVGIQFPQADNKTILNLSSTASVQMKDIQFSAWQSMQLENLNYINKSYQPFSDTFSTKQDELILYPDLQCYEPLEMGPSKSDDIVWLSDYTTETVKDATEKTSSLTCSKVGVEGVQDVFVVSCENHLNSSSCDDKCSIAESSHNKRFDLASAIPEKSIGCKQDNLETIEVQSKQISNWLPSTSRNKNKINVNASTFPTICDCALYSNHSNSSDISIENIENETRLSDTRENGPDSSIAKAKPKTKSAYTEKLKTTARPSTRIPSEDSIIYVPIPELPGLKNIIFEPYIPTEKEMSSKSLSQQLKEFIESTKQIKDSKNLPAKSEPKSQRNKLKRKSNESDAGSTKTKSKVSKVIRKKLAANTATLKCNLPNTSVAVPVRQINKTTGKNTLSLHSSYPISFDSFSFLKNEITKKYHIGDQMVYVKDLLKINKFDLIGRGVKMSDILPNF